MSTCVTATGTLEEVVVRNGYDEAALFVHARFPDDVRKFTLTIPTERVFCDDLYPGTDVLLTMTPCGFAEYQGIPQRGAPNHLTSREKP